MEIKTIANKINQQKGLRYIILFAFLVFVAGAAIAQTGDVIFVHDPCIIKSGDYYYIFSTGDRIEMRRSADIQKWDRLNQVFSSIPEWGIEEVPGVNNIWAPDIFYRDSTYYLYYSLSTFGSNRSCIGLATNKTLNPGNADYQWIDQGKVIESNSGDSYNAIDPNIARDNLGKLWLSFGSYWSGIKIIELDSMTMKPKSGAALHSLAMRHNWGAIEAPYIIYRNGFYYLFVSFDACCQGINSTYKVRVGRSEAITGPYADKNDVAMLSGGGSLIIAGDDRWRGPGHCAVLQEAETTWLVHHAYDAENNGVPTLRIEKLIWTEEGWPQLETLNSAHGSIEIHQPIQFVLHQNFPNPFNPETTINYELRIAGDVQLTVLDVTGKIVKILVNQKQLAGEHSVVFNAANLASGLYYYKLKIDGQFERTRKMILLN